MGEGKVCLVLLHCRNSPAEHGESLAPAGLGPETWGRGKLCVSKNVIDFKLRLL